jgi:hypothetical protein
MTAAWTAPKTWSVGELVTAALLNTHLRDNLEWLYSKRQDVLLYEDQKTAGTGAAAITTGAWRTRELTTEVIDTGAFGGFGGAVPANQISLAAGTYLAYFNSPVGTNVGSRSRLRNVTDGATLVNGGNNLYVGVGFGRFVLAATKTIELQQWVSANTNGGAALSSGEVEVYAQLLLLRIGD